MGQRHQLFVIARVGSHYRSLVAVHHQWLYGLSALRQCLQILRIFSSQANRLAIKQELAFAAAFFGDEAPPQDRPHLSYETSAPCPFPFITTCLMVGAAHNRATAHVSVVHEEPFGMGYDQGDNNDGITVLDITDPGNARYCFVNFLGWDEFDNPSSLEEREPRDCRKKLNQPLSGWEYLLAYYNRSHENVRNGKPTLESLSHYLLVEAEALAETWPWGAWGVATPSMSGPTESQSHGAVGLVDQCLAKLVEAGLSDENFDATMLDENIKNMPQFRQRLQQQLIVKADQVCSSSASVAFLKLAYAGEQALDWTPFINLGAEALKTALASEDLQGVTDLNISGIAAAQSPKDLVDALGVVKNLRKLYVLEVPDRESDSVGVLTFSLIAASNPHLIKDNVLFSAPFSRAVRRRPWLKTQAYLPAFPAVQLLVYHGGSSRYPSSLEFEFFYLGDAFLGPERLVTGLFQYLETLMDWWRGRPGSATEAVICFAATSPSLGDFETIEVGPLAAEVYSLPEMQLKGHSGKIRDLLPGQWTILLSQDCMQSEQRLPGVGFKYAFVRPKSAIQVKPVGDVPQVKLEDLHVVDFAGFLQQTAPQVDVEKLEKHFDKLNARASETHQNDGKEILAFLEPEDARALLMQCILAENA